MWGIQLIELYKQWGGGGHFQTQNDIIARTSIKHCMDCDFVVLFYINW